MAFTGKCIPRRMICEKDCDRAFTLTELLVVIAVVAILATLTLVGVGKLQGRANSVHCVGNLRQIAVLLNSYAGEHNGYYPRDAYAQGYRGGGVRWAPEHFLLDYDGFTKGENGRIIEEAPPAPNSLFRCPGETSETDTAGRIWYQSHYGFNFSLVHTTAEEMNNPLSSNPYRRPLSAIANPSKVFLVGDTQRRYAINSASGTTRSLAFRHGSQNACHVAFVDGHVETLPPSSLDFAVGGPAALGWDQFIEWGGDRKSPGSPRY